MSEVVLVCGSRGFRDVSAVAEWGYDNLNNPDITVIHGDCPQSPDVWWKLKEPYCIEGKFPANWKAWGKRAAAKRNQVMANLCDRCVAFWDGESRGTLMTIEMVKALGKPVEIIYRGVEHGTV